MKKIFLFLSLFVFLQANSQEDTRPPQRASRGISLPFIQPDTLSTAERDALTPKLGTVLYHKDVGISVWEGWNGSSWQPFSTDQEAIHTTLANEISGLSLKIIPIDADQIVIEDSEASYFKRRVDVGSLPFVDKDSPELITRKKTFNNTEDESNIEVVNDSDIHSSISSTNVGNAAAFSNINITDGIGVKLNASPTAGGYAIVSQNNGSDTFSLNKEGDVVANSINGLSTSNIVTKDGDEVITGSKEFNNTTLTPNLIITNTQEKDGLQANNTGDGNAIKATNSGFGTAISVTNTYVDGVSIYSNTIDGIGIESITTGAGDAFRAYASPTSTGYNFIGGNQLATTFTVDKDGDVGLTAINSTDINEFIIGPGTNNYIPKYSSANTLSNSVLYDTGVNLGIGTESPNKRLEIVDVNNFQFRLTNTGVGGTTWDIGSSNDNWTSGGGKLLFVPSGNLSVFSTVCFSENGNVGIGTITPSDKLEVDGVVLSNATASEIAAASDKAVINKEYKPRGVLDYADAATTTTPINLTLAGGYVYLPNDGLGVNTNTLYPPTGVTSVWSTSLNQFDFSQLSLGSKVHFRFSAKVTTTGSNQEVEVDLDAAIGSGGSYTLDYYINSFKSSGTYEVVFSDYIYIGNTNTRDFPSKFKIKSDGNATVTVNGWACDVLLY